MTTTRLHYLDWLRVLAVLGVFLYHAVHPFDLTDWHIKNAELSFPLTVLLMFFSPWGMPFFFLIAGTGTWFALRHRTMREYASERIKRLFIPFVFGCLLLTPLMLYVEWSHKVQTGLSSNTFWEFISSRGTPVGPQIFGYLGYHLWFLGFLFSYSLLALPVFLWLRSATGQKWLSRLAGWCEHRGTILLAIIPLLMVQLPLRIIYYQGEHNWADFFYMLCYFVAGYVLYTDQRFTHAVRRDWRLILGVALVATAIAFVFLSFTNAYEWASMPWHPGFYLVWTFIVICGWSWVLVLLFVGMRFLDFSNQWLEYGQEAVLPFFLFHQPIIMLVAFFVVQWNAAILPKLLIVVPGSFVITVGLYELLVRRSGSLRMIFGMKSSRHQSLHAV